MEATAAIFTIVFGTIGIVFFGVGVWIIYRNNLIKRNGKKTRAQVVELKKVRYKQDGYGYEQILEFRTSRGQWVRQGLGYSSSIKPKEKVPFYKEIYYLETQGNIKITPVKHSAFIWVGWVFGLIGFTFIGLLVLDAIDLLNIVP